MAYIFRTKKRDGSGFHARYRFEYVDFRGRRRKATGFTSKADTERLANRVQAEQDAIRKGFIPAPKESSKPWTFDEVSDAYLAYGSSQGGRGGRPWAAEHARKRKSHLTWWKEKLGLTRLADLVGSLPRVEAALQNLQNAGASGKNLLLRAESIRSFCLWCVKREFLAEDPLRGLSRFDTTPKETRRAMTAEEIGLLLTTAPERRRLLYEVAFLTGLRAGELRALSVGDLDTKRGGLILDPAWTKNRKGCFHPLPFPLMDRLKRVSRGKRRETPLLCVPSHPARELDKDLEAAGVQKRTEDGKLDFHACRVAYATFAIEAGATVKEAQALLRHSTPQLTMGLYARARDDRMRAVVDNLGRLVLPPGQPVTPTGPQQGKDGETSDVASEDEEEASDKPKKCRTGVRFPPPPPKSSSRQDLRDPGGFLRSPLPPGRFSTVAGVTIVRGPEGRGS